MGMTNSDWKEAYNVVCDDRDAMRSAHGKAVDRIRELEAELAVRDNSANEVLRILREATGKRDFHSEMEAAEHAAKMLAEARKDSARLAFVLDIDNDQIQWSSVPWFGEAIDHIVSQQPKTKTDWESKWLEVVRKHIDAAIDAAIKEEL